MLKLFINNNVYETYMTHILISNHYISYDPYNDKQLKNSILILKHQIYEAVPIISGYHIIDIITNNFQYLNHLLLNFKSNDIQTLLNYKDLKEFTLFRIQSKQQFIPIEKILTMNNNI